MAKEFELAASSGGQRSQQILEQMQEKTALALQQAQTQLNQEGSAVKSLTVRNRYYTINSYRAETIFYYFKNNICANRELDHQIRELGNEKVVLVKMIDEAKSTIEKLKVELKQTRSTVSQLTGQLAQSYTARDERAERTARSVVNICLIYCTHPSFLTDLWTLFFRVIVHSGLPHQMRE